MPQNKSLSFRLSVRLILVLLFLALLPFRSKAAEKAVVRVGLYFGNNALPAANLANEVGSGYEFGVFSPDGAFTALGGTEREKITVCKDSNLYYANGAFHETQSEGASLLGAYHIQLPGSYSSFEEARTAAAGYRYGFPAYVDGAYVVRFEFYSAPGNAAADQSAYPGSTIVGGSASCYTVADTTNGAILFEYDCGEDSGLGIRPAGEMSRTWFKGFQYYGGFQYARRAGNDLTVVNFVDEDLYVSGVLPYEFVPSGSLESLKAGAIAIRTFTRATNKHNASGFDLCNTTDCQVYRGAYTGDCSENILKTVQETEGLCCYYDGEPIQALYSSSDGGATEDAVNAWGVDYPYLKGKSDPYESTITFGGQNWTYRVSASDLEDLLDKRGYSCGHITGFAVTETTPNGNVNEITLTGSSGKEIKFTKDNVRILQSLPGVTYMSRRFQIHPGNAVPAADGGFSVYDGSTTVSMNTITAITANGNVTVSAPAEILTDGGVTTVRAGDTVSIAAPAGESSGFWTITGSGYGHNIGMSQWGAYAMGKAGCTYEEILKFYYTGITIQ